MKAKKSEKQKWGPFLKFYLKVKVPWHLYIFTYLIQFGITSVNLMLPLVTADIMSGKIMDSKIVVKFVGLTLLVALLMLVQIIANAFADSMVQRNTKNLIWSKIIRIPLMFYNKEKPSGFISRITSDTEQLSGPLNCISSVIDGVYGFVGSFIIMYGMNKRLTYLMLMLLPWIFFVIWIIGRLNFTVTNRLQKFYSEMTSFLNERLGNIKLIKSFAVEDKEIKEGYKSVGNYYKAEIYSAKIGLLSQPIAKSMDTAIILIVIVIGAKFVSKGQMKIEDLIAFYMYTNNMIFPNIYAVLQSFQLVKGSQGATAKIGQILETDTEHMEREKSFNIPDNDITFKNVAFSYDEKEILSDLSFTIPKGKVTAIVGQNGAGKTTIFNLIERFYEPQKGSILFGNIPVEKIHLNEWRKAFGYVSQNSPLVSGTIRDNIIYGVNRDISEEEIIRAAKLANAYDFIQQFPDKFDTEVGEVGGKLSGGQRQRIAIARAIIKNPDYLLLDEATCNLDAQADKAVQEALNNLMAGRTTITIAHNMKTVVNADQIIVINNGKVDGTGKHEELYENNEIYRKFVNLQKAS